MAKKHAFQKFGDNMARSIGKDVGVSTLQSIEIANLIRGMNVDKALKRLALVEEMKQPVPYRVRSSAPHKSGHGPGKFPLKCTAAFISLLKQAKANAQYKGLAADLEIVHVNANLAARPYRYGRKGGVQSKRSHIEIVVAEASPAKKEKKESKKAVKKEDPKPAPKAKEKKEVPKQDPKPAEVAPSKETPKPAEKKSPEPKKETKQ